MERRSVLIGVVAGLALAGLPSFLDHFVWFMTGQVNELVVEQRWDLVALNIIGFLAFLIPLSYRHKADWKSYGLYAAFIVSLFIEMYGIPLTIYFTSSFMTGTPAAAQQAFLVEFSVLGQQLGMTFWMLTGAVITAIGMGIVAIGWYQVYRGDGLVTDGIYAVSRHPQYVGIAMIVTGWWIGWPTLLTTLLLPVLLYSYYNAAQAEEEEVREGLDDPSAYDEYRQQVPMFI